MRIARRWNQTGQKFAGEPDIARTFLFGHRWTLWVLIGATYLWNLRSLASHSFPQLPRLASVAIATALASASFTFKLAFTFEDSPELMIGPALYVVENDLGISLVTRARVVFAFIGIASVYSIFASFSRAKGSSCRFLTMNLVQG
jgi:ethanolaminephosphotransferase